MTTREIDVVLVDDHAIVRQGLRAVLERDADIRIVGEASNPTEAIEVVAGVRPRVVVLDLKLSAGASAEGLTVCADINERFPETAVLVLTTFLDEQLILQAIQHGARGYVVKDVDTSNVLRAIRDVSAGQSYFDSRTSAALVRGLNAPEQPGSEDLTGRERQVLALLAAGMSNAQIGKELYISATTAKFHVGNILRKLRVTRRAEAVYAASKRGLI